MYRSKRTAICTIAGMGMYLASGLNDIASLDDSPFAGSPWLSAF
jgi:hypothetical protein